MKQKGLGRGLDAIFGNDHLDAKLKPMTEMAEIAVSEIIPNPTQPRTQFDEEALDELADSIRTLGVIQPITVKRQGDGKNIQRQDLNAIEIALGMQRLIDECGLTQDALSEKVGKKRSTVSNFLRLLKLPDEIQLALKEGLISAGHAKAIAGAPADRQLHLLKRCIKKDLSVRQIEELVRSFNAQRPAEPAEDEEYPESYLRLVEQLERFFSQEISIKRSKNGGGKIVIDFAGDADIEKFLTRFADK